MLPTGKNIHALDPQSIPTQAAVKSARIVVERLLEVQRQENGGAWPETVAVVLWGTDNIKTYGESLAQVRTVFEYPSSYCRRHQAETSNGYEISFNLKGDFSCCQNSQREPCHCT